jgi:hypothetical protein
VGEVAAQTLEVTTAEAGRVAEAAKAAKLPLVLIGGVAIWIRCPSAHSAPLARDYGDIDFVGRSGDRRAITEFMQGQGYEADRMFNAIHGATRLNYHDPVRNRPVDVLLDRFVMAHELDLRGALGADELTVPLADLLLTKLQVVSLNRKDLVDILALLLDHPLGQGEIEVERILEVTRSDWGFEHTIHHTLATLRERMGEFELSPTAVSLILERAAELDATLDAAPKSVAWKMRARLGERVKWYQEPEEART